MTKRAFLLMGLAIVAVVWSHAAGWGQIAMFHWADRYRPVTVPNFDEVGTPSYYVLLVIRQLTVWSVPAFLFVSGYFVAYAMGRQQTLRWKVVASRLRHLLVPYFIWSSAIFLASALEGTIYTPLEYVEQLVFGTADGTFFYVPLLCQFYLLAFLFAPLASRKSQVLLLIAAVLQLGTISLRYLVLFGVDVPEIDLMGETWPWLFVWWVFYFPLGVVCGLHVRRFSQWLVQHKGKILVATVVLGVLAILEPEVIYRTTGVEWRFVPLTITTTVYAVAFVFCFLSFEKIPEVFSKAFSRFNKAALGIYLLHMTAMAYVARFIRQIAPSLLAYPVLFLNPLLLIVGLGVPLFLMNVVSKSPARKYYRLLFG
jgi:membrane-bound acyltransferase YfiQ involved in biofilm formation